MDNTTIARYSELKAAQEDIGLKRAAAEARLQDSEAAMATAVAEVKAQGFGSVAELQTAIAAAEGELNILLEEAEAKLKAGGYAG